MIKEIEKILEEDSCDLASWIRTNFKKTLNRDELQEEELRKDILIIANGAYFTNFVEDSCYEPDGIRLSRLKKYNGAHKEFIQTFISELASAQDLCGYIHKYLAEANF